MAVVMRPYRMTIADRMGSDLALTRVTVGGVPKPNQYSECQGRLQEIVCESGPNFFVGFAC
jgi:hypothetical protein